MIIHTTKHDTTDVKAELARLTNWHPWFAWHPVWTGVHLRWLEWVERKFTPAGGDCDIDYRPLDLENYP